MILQLLQIGGALGIFLYGMKLMSDGIQKTAGDRLRTVLNFMTINRFTAVLTGTVVTGIIQSSSATTVMVVSLVNAGLFSLKQAIGVIMGANIGTTVTAWIVALIGFSMDIAAFALPSIALSLPFLFIGSLRKKDFGEFLLGFGLLFLGLSLLKSYVPNIKDHPEALQFLTAYTGLGMLSYLIFVAAGTILTIVIQSSSAAMAITLTMAYSGWIDLPTAASLCLGENIGTTITAYLAAMNQNVTARRAARAHTLFNMIGVFWMAFAFRPFLFLLTALIPDDPGSRTVIAERLALFHTMFNAANTFLFIWFVGPYERLVTFLVRPRKGEESLRYRLVYSAAESRQSPEINIIKAQAEIKKLAGLVEDIYVLAGEAVSGPYKKAAATAEVALSKKELISAMHDEITKFLVHSSRENLTQKSQEKINLLVRIVNELDSIADSCGKLANCALHKADKKIEFDKQGSEQIVSFLGMVKNFLDFNNVHLSEHLTQAQLEEALNFENAIDENRDSMKKGARKRLKHRTTGVKDELLFIDILKHVEHIGDHSFEISRSLYQIHSGLGSVPAVDDRRSKQ